MSDCLIYGEKGYPVVIADMHLDRLFHCSESVYFSFGTRISYFFCWNIPVPEKPFANAKAVISVLDIPVTKVSYF
jgi:hypothetical protein